MSRAGGRSGEHKSMIPRSQPRNMSTHDLQANKEPFPKPQTDEFLSGLTQKLANVSLTTEANRDNKRP